MSSKINVAAIIEQYGLSKLELASDLFPNNKYASMALTRVINGEAFLNSEQLSLLANKLGVTVDSLYADREWDLKSNSAGVLKFENGSMIAELDTETWITKVYKKGSLIHETVLHNGSITIANYLEKLNNLINNK